MFGWTEPMKDKTRTSAEDSNVLTPSEDNNIQMRQKLCMFRMDLALLNSSA